MNGIRRDQESKRVKSVFRDCFNLHAAKLAELGTVETETFWNDFFVRMNELEAQHPDDALFRALIIAIHADLEALEKQNNTDHEKEMQNNEQSRTA